METRDKVTRDALREMREGETWTFKLANAQACDTSKSAVYQMQNILQCDFTVQTDYASNTLTVTKLPR